MNQVWTTRTTLKWIVAIAVTVCAPLLSQADAADSGANGLILGSWNSQVEFDVVKVVCGKKTVLEDSFSAETSGWKREGGGWKVVNGVLRQGCKANQDCGSSVFIDPALAATPTAKLIHFL